MVVTRRPHSRAGLGSPSRTCCPPLPAVWSPSQRPARKRGWGRRRLRLQRPPFRHRRRRHPRRALAWRCAHPLRRPPALAHGRRRTGASPPLAPRTRVLGCAREPRRTDERRWQRQAQRATLWQPAKRASACRHRRRWCWTGSGACSRAKRSSSQAQSVMATQATEGPRRRQLPRATRTLWHVCCMAAWRWPRGPSGDGRGCGLLTIVLFAFI